jgi:hypothetical protein
MDQGFVLLEQVLQAGSTSPLGAAKFAGMIGFPVLYNIHVTPPWVFGLGKPNLPKEVSLVYSVDLALLLELTFSFPTYCAIPISVLFSEFDTP